MFSDFDSKINVDFRKEINKWVNELQEKSKSNVGTDTFSYNKNGNKQFFSNVTVEGKNVNYTFSLPGVAREDVSLEKINNEYVLTVDSKTYNGKEYFKITHTISESGDVLSYSFQNGILSITFTKEKIGQKIDFTDIASGQING